MREKPAGSGVDAIGAAAVIDLVQIEFENLLLGKFPLHGEREQYLAAFPAKSPVIVEKHIAGQLLGDRRSALRPVPALHPDLQGPRDTDRIDTEVAFVAAVLDGNHCVFHDLRDIGIAEPLAIARPHGKQLLAVYVQHPDHLAIGGRFQILEAG